MIRKNLIRFHLYMAAFLAPLFILLAISGGLYLINIKGQFNQTPVNLPDGAVLDFASDTLQADIEGLLAASGAKPRIGWVTINRGAALTHPRTRTNYVFEEKDGKLIATRNRPDLQKTMIELHKGHGPPLFKLYQKLAAIGLLFIVISGVWMGLASRVLRTETLIASGIGMISFILLGFLL